MCYGVEAKKKKKKKKITEIPKKSQIKGKMITISDTI